jgi:hypothetical protein
LLITASLDGRVVLWETPTFQFLRFFEETLPVTSLAYATERDLLVIGTTAAVPVWGNDIGSIQEGAIVLRRMETLQVSATL